MGNNNPCEAISEEKVRIKMFGVVRTILHVKHAPTLKKNLLSLRVFDDQGFLFSGKNWSKSNKNSLGCTKGRKSRQSV